MKFSTRTRYGIRAMIEIARYTDNDGIFQKDISTNTGISNKYLDHIIHGLKVAGLISTYKGRKSGYILTRPASEISALDIHSAFEPGICVIDCMSKTYQCDRSDGCEARGFWGGLNRSVFGYFQSISLQDILDNKLVLDDAIPD